MADTGNRAPQAPQHSANNDVQTAELNMRRALGLNTRGPVQTPQQRPEQARQRHRFVQDGGVPVVVLNHRPDEVSALKEQLHEARAALEAERASHNNTRRTLAEQVAATQAVQTRLAHAELAHAEALAQERKALAAAQESLATALAAPARQAPARPPARPSERPPAIRRVTRPASAGDTTEAAAEKPKRGRPRINPIPEPKPVRWWTPSFRAKTKA